MHLVYHWLFTPVVLLNESEMLKWAGCQTLPLVALSAVQPHCAELRLSLGYRETLPEPETVI